MKLLTNKRYRELVGEIKALEMDLNEERRKNGRLRSEKEQLQFEAEKMQKDLYRYEEKTHRLKADYQHNIEVLEEERKSLLGAKGGYVKENNKLKKQIEELEEKLKESMTDKYRVKKIPTGRRPKGPAMKLTSHAVVSKITRKMHDNG